MEYSYDMNMIALASIRSGEGFLSPKYANFAY